MIAHRYSTSFLGITFSGVACVLAACFGPPFTLRAPPTESGEGGGGAGGHGGGGAAGGAQAGGAGGEGGAVDTTLAIQDSKANPIVGVMVVVNDETGVAVVVTESDDDGRAVVVIPMGGSASVFSTVEAALHVRTIVDPPPGLTIPVIIERPAGAMPAPTQYQVVIVAEPLGTDRVYVWSTCDSAWSDMILDNDACRDAPSIDFLAVAYDAEENAIGWGILEAQATSPGGGTMFIPLDVTQAAFHTLNAAITGMLPPTSYAGLTVFADLSVEALLTMPSPLTPPPLAATLRVPAVPGIGYRVHEFAWSWPDALGPLGQIERARHYAVMPASSTFAVTSMAPLSLNPLDPTDPVHPELTWNVAGGERGDQGTVTLSWSSGIVSVTYEAVFAPDRTTAFRVPDIPSALSSSAPSATTTFGSVSVWYDDFENGAGYADVLDGLEPVDGLGRIRSGAYLTQP